MMPIRRQSLVRYGAPLEPTEEMPPPLKEGEVLLRVSHCGLCHSDLHLMDGHFDLGEGKRLDITQGRKLPLTPGHEICGTIEAYGPKVMGIAAEHRLYAVYPWIGCGLCQRCLGGDEQLCDDMRHLGINRDGGFASHVLVPHPRYLIDVDGIDANIAGSYMCSGLTAYSALKKTAFSEDGPLLMVGFGGVGSMALAIARHLVQRPIAVADIDETKRAAARRAGADFVLDPTEPDARKLLRSAMGRMEAVVDFVGSEQSLDFAQSAVGKGGIIVVVGLMGGRASLPVPMFPLRQLTIAGSFVGSLAEARELIDLVRKDGMQSIPVTVRPLEEINAAIEDLREGRVIGRIVLRPPGNRS